MKGFIVATLALLQLASAVPVEQVHALDPRQLLSANDLKNGKCAGNVFIFARGSTETDNMGTICGPQTCSGLKQNLGGDVICQGLGTVDGYAADVPSNLLSKNTNDGAIAGAVKMIGLAATQCPDAKILLAGYSQGSAVMDNAIQQLPAATKAKVGGVVMFGFTRNLQDKGGVPGFPAAQTKVFCAPGDLVCTGTLVITAAHLTYGSDASAAAAFLAGKTKQ